ncbi:hypothetical protein GCM10012320_33890 [Sinomonas cellulolyticus]|uniref:Uncharacterized protein n=1 Tax=Sinomonas cellulolyticus TaxID=2801916 RepID=A0ABS1K5P4_9MICC|nr:MULTISPECIES: hypothetical protein [Sinomonas]MBL0707001.1 hypothetical protein [Sinomonas cellulolyticus]GHG59660.1 hypothetical protein GCM10012320_33890 [Sinomonas sp. KCTC 49339]
MSEADTMTSPAPRWWAVKYTAVPDPIEADTDYCFGTAAEAAEHGQPWAVLEHPAAYTAGPVSPGHYITAGHHDDAAYCLATREPVRDEDRGTWYRFS